MGMSIIEVERKYLAWLNKSFEYLMHQAVATGESDAIQHIRQGYLISTKFAELRMRECEECNSADYRMGLKLGNGYKRIEIEWDMPKWLFFKLLPHSHWFSKTRLQINGWLVDKFNGRLRGLILVEREEHAGEQQQSMPDGITLIREVTSEGTFANKNLAKLANYEVDKLFAKEGIYNG
jgi:CYTH domain-containing protein